MSDGISIWTVGAAWGGFFLSVAKWIVDLRKRKARLSVELRASKTLVLFGPPIPLGPPPGSYSHHFTFRGVNRGGPPIQVCCIGYDLQGGASGEIAPPRSLPRTIKPEMSETFVVDLPPEEDLIRITGAWLEDSRRRKWHVAEAEVREAVAEARQMLAEAAETTRSLAELRARLEGLEQH